MNLRTALLSLVLFSISFQLHSKHLIGGDATYEFVSYNSDSTEITYRIRFTLYRDTSDPTGANLFNREDFGIYSLDSQGQWVYVDDYDADRSPLITIDGIDEPCREEPPPSEVGVETAFYEKLYTFKVIDSDYMITYQRCCRNSSIGNMFAFEEGAVIDLLITAEAQRTGNSSPTFDAFPPIFICSGFPLDVPVTCTDPEGDEIRYSFCNPIASGGNNGGTGCTSRDPSPRNCPPPYKELQYRPPFNASAPMGGNPIVRVNATTGLITGVPEVLGQYVVGICVEEYRNGVLLSRLRRDFQFNVLPCIKELSANLVADEMIIDNSMGVSRPISVIKACGDSLVDFKGLDVNNTIIDYQWNIYNPTNELVLDTSGRDVRNLSVYFPELGQYNGTLVVIDSEGCIDTAFINVLRLPDLETNFDFEILDSCYLGEVAFTDLSEAEASEIVEWDWNFASEDNASEQNPNFEFDGRGLKKVTLVTKDLNTCIDTFIAVIDYNPPHDSLMNILPPVLTLCYGDSIQFDNIWRKEAGFYEQLTQYKETGCDSAYTTMTLDYYPKPTETYLDTILCPSEFVDYYGTIYNEERIKSTGENSFMHVTSSIESGCDSILHFIQYEYEIIPELTIEEEFLYLVANKSTKIPVSLSGIYDRVIWTPAYNLDCNDCPFPTVSSEDDTTYVIEVLTDDNCLVSDSIYIDFIVVPEKYYLPTVLSSESIDKNDRYLYLMTQENAYETVTYDLKVLDRWGGLLFEGSDLRINDRTEGWSVRNTLPGSYTYLMNIHEFFESKQLVGTVSIIE